MPCTVTVRSVFSIGVTTLAASSDIIILPSLVTGGTITLRTIRNLSCLYDTIQQSFLDVFVGFVGASRGGNSSVHVAAAPQLILFRCFCGFCGRVSAHKTHKNIFT